MTQNIMVGSYNVTLEQPATSGSFLATTKQWTQEAKGAFDLMNLIKKTATACGDTATAGLVGVYTSAAAFPYFVSLVAGFPKMIKETFSQTMNFYRAMEFTSKITELGAMGLYSASFFLKDSAAGSAGVIFDTMSDMAEMPTIAMDAKETYDVLQLAKKLEMSKDVQSDLGLGLQHMLIKLAKSVSSTVHNIFASYAIVYGAALITATAALALSLTATICNMADYYHQNYLSGHIIKSIALV